MSRIDALTPDQIARYSEHVDRWTRIGLCTDPADRPRAEDAMRRCYSLAGLVQPQRIVWCESPMSQAITRYIAGASVGGSVRVGVWVSVGAGVRASVWDSVRASVRAGVGDSAGASVGDSVRAGVLAGVGDSVGDRVGDSVLAGVRASVWDRVGDSVLAGVWDRVGDSVRAGVLAGVGASVGDSVRASVYGSHDAGWLSFYAFFRDVVGLAGETDRATGLMDLARCAGWAIPHERVCWISERHHILRRDDRGRIHCEDGPAIAYPDGWAIYAVHGVRVPEYVIERPEEISPAKIDGEKNSEIRRVMLDRFGPGRYLRDTGTQAIHSDDFGSLYRREVPGDEPLVMVRVTNSTPEPDGSRRDYWLRVPPTISRAREAVAWTFAMKEEEYVPSQES